MHKEVQPIYLAHPFPRDTVTPLSQVSQLVCYAFECRFNSAPSGCVFFLFSLNLFCFFCFLQSNVAAARSGKVHGDVKKRTCGVMTDVAANACLSAMKSVVGSVSFY